MPFAGVYTALLCVHVYKYMYVYILYINIVLHLGRHHYIYNMYESE